MALNLSTPQLQGCSCVCGGEGNRQVCKDAGATSAPPDPLHYMEIPGKTKNHIQGRGGYGAISSLEMFQAED